MKNKLFLLVFSLFLVGCNKSEESMTNTNNTINQNSSKKEYVKDDTEESSGIESSTTMERKEKDLEFKNRNLENYNSLPIEMKIKLIATIVDDRAIPVKIPDLEGTMFYDFYSVSQDELYINVHSGAGVGHPIYLLKIDEETVTPIEGVVNTGVEQYEAVVGIDQTPVYKAVLYEQYIDNKELYDSDVIKAEDSSEWLKESFNKIKSKI